MKRLEARREFEQLKIRIFDKCHGNDDVPYAWTALFDDAEDLAESILKSEAHDHSLENDSTEFLFKIRRDRLSDTVDPTEKGILAKYFCLLSLRLLEIEISHLVTERMVEVNNTVSVLSDAIKNVNRISIVTNGKPDSHFVSVSENDKMNKSFYDVKEVLSDALSRARVEQSRLLSEECHHDFQNFEHVRALTDEKIREDPDLLAMATKKHS